MYRHALVRALMVHYAEAASVERPLRVFTRAGTFETYMARRGGLTSGEKIHLRKGHAFNVRRVRTPHEVFVNLARHPHVAELADSAAHEITHLRWPSLTGCSSKTGTFAQRKNALLAGYRCGPPRSRLPPAFR